MHLRSCKPGTLHISGLTLTIIYSVYSLFSALIMHVYQMRASNPAIVSASQERIQICMNAMKDVSRVWLVAKMVHTLFESILGNRALEERLQKAAGKRHQKGKAPGQATVPATANEAMKRKYDDMSMGYTPGPPAPQMSYERSRPQSPVAQSAQPVHGNNLPPTSPNVTRSSEAFLPGLSSKGNTRPTTPFNPTGFSVPATPPDLFLVTRSSPPISQQLWENFQPDQLFPEGSGMAPFSPNGRGAVDPQLQMSSGMPPGGNAGGMSGVTMPPVMSPPDGSGRHMSVGSMSQQMQGQHWPQVQSIDGMLADSSQQGQPQGQEDNWSTSSTGQPAVPTTLNVEDW